MNLNLFLKYKGHHILGWIIYIVFWYFIYRAYYDSGLLLFQVILVYLFAHGGMYYGIQYGLISSVINRRKIVLLIVGFLGLAFLLALMMVGLLSWILEDSMPRYFGDNKEMLFLSFFTSNIFVGGMLLGGKSVIDRVRQQRKNEQINQERLLSELSYLKAQVNPHFLFNAINSVFVLIRKDPDQAAETLIKLSDLLRSQLYDFSTELISIEDEIQYLENYIALEKIRMGHRVHVEVFKRGNLKGFRLPPLLLMPFLENCFKHLSSFHDRENQIKVDLHRDEDKLIATFTNTFEKDQPSVKPGGIGLANVRRRLDLLYGKEYSLRISEHNTMYTVELKIKIHE